MIFLYKNTKIFLYFCMILFGFATQCSSASRDRVSIAPTGAPLSLQCMQQAAEAHQVPLVALVGILATEGGKPGEALSNTNGSWDVGPFQVNTCHMDKLSALGLNPYDVMGDACLNASVAAWLLRQQAVRSADIWEAVGAYHSRTPRYHSAYIERVRANISLLLSSPDMIQSLLQYANGKRSRWK